MDPKLKAILQKSKQIDQAAKKYDTVDRTVLEQKVNSRTSGGNSGGGLFDQMGVGGGTSSPQQQNVNVFSEEYQNRVSNSKLPPEIQRAMAENPIPQPSMVDSFDVDDIKDINPGAYSEEDEYVEMPTERRPVREQVSNNVEMVKGPSQQGFDNHVIKKMIAEEISKVLPGVVERYFDNKIIKENTRLMKVLLKESRNRK
jgi:hypothetical protein